MSTPAGLGFAVVAIFLPFLPDAGFAVAGGLCLPSELTDSSQPVTHELYDKAKSRGASTADQAIEALWDVVCGVCDGALRLQRERAACRAAASPGVCAGVSGSPCVWSWSADTCEHDHSLQRLLVDLDDAWPRAIAHAAATQCTAASSSAACGGSALQVDPPSKYAAWAAVDPSGSTAACDWLGPGACRGTPDFTLTLGEPQTMEQVILARASVYIKNCYAINDSTTCTANQTTNHCLWTVAFDRCLATAGIFDARWFRGYAYCAYSLADAAFACMARTNEADCAASGGGCAWVPPSYLRSGSVDSA